MQVQGAIPRALADDLTTISIGENAMPSTTAALYATFEYLNAFGGKVRVQKTWAYAVEKGIRQKLAEVKFPGQNNIILEVVHEHRDLGGHLDFTLRRTGTTFKNRIKDATRQCHQLANLPGPFKNRHRLIDSKLIPKGLYGASTAPDNWAELNKFFAAIADNYNGKDGNVSRHTRSQTLTFYACGTNNESTADPWYCIFYKRLFDLRRACVKRTHLRQKINEIVAAYHNDQRPGTQTPIQGVTIPMPRGRAICDGG